MYKPSLKDGERERALHWREGLAEWGWNSKSVGLGVVTCVYIYWPIYIYIYMSSFSVVLNHRLWLRLRIGDSSPTAFLITILRLGEITCVYICFKLKLTSHSHPPLLLLLLLLRAAAASLSLWWLKPATYTLTSRVTSFIPRKEKER